MSHPILQIEIVDGSKLGNCYYSQTYKITSLSPLNKEDIENLRNSGFLGYGQEFGVKNDLIHYDNNNTAYEPILESLTTSDGTEQEYHVYYTYNRVDSSD